MPKKTPIINDFRSGELTPDADVRVDIKDYYTGCRVLQGQLPILEGGVARIPGTHYVNPTRDMDDPLPSPIVPIVPVNAFIPYHITHDGTNLWVFGYLSSTGNGGIIQKIDPVTGLVLDQLYDKTNVSLYFHGIVEEDYVYVCGRLGTNTGIVHKRPKSDLATIEQSYSKQVTAIGAIVGLVSDDDNLYFSGYQTANVWRGALQKSDLSQVWFFNNTSAQSYGLCIAADYSVLYIFYQNGTLTGRRIDQVNPANGAIVASFNYGGGFPIRGCISNGQLYLTGSWTDDVLVAYKKAALMNIGLSDMIKDWEVNFDTVGSADEYYTACTDGTNIFAVGRCPQTAGARIICVDTAGNAIWSKTAAVTRPGVAIGTLGDFIYVMGWDTSVTPNTKYIEKRSKADGQVIPFS